MLGAERSRVFERLSAIKARERPRRSRSELRRDARRSGLRFRSVRQGRQMFRRRFVKVKMSALRILAADRPFPGASTFRPDAESRGSSESPRRPGLPPRRRGRLTWEPLAAVKRAQRNAYPLPATIAAGTSRSPRISANPSAASSMLIVGLASCGCAAKRQYDAMMNKK